NFVVVDLWRDAIVKVFGEKTQRRFSSPAYLPAGASSRRGAERPPPPPRFGVNPRGPPPAPLGAFASDTFASRNGPLPQCPESDGWPSKCRPSRWAKFGHCALSTAAYPPTASVSDG